MVQSVKRAIKSIMKSLGAKAPTVLVLGAALAEAVTMINSRPLTHTPVNHEDEMPLTPNDLLGQSRITTILGLADNGSNYCQLLYRRVQHLAIVFTTRWAKEYLPVISRRCKWFDNVKPFEVDDIVLIINPAVPRNI
jgi:Family of unknown function (DUF5641)